jgi:hypothetical protein
VSMILMRTLRNDYAKYAREDDDLDSLVSFNWSASLSYSSANRTHDFF